MAEDDDSDLIDLLKKLFAEFCIDQEVEGQAMESVKSRDFIHWLVPRWEVLNRYEAAQHYEVEESALDKMDEFCHDPTCIPNFDQCLDLFRFSSRPEPKVPIRCIRMILMLEFENNHYLPVMINMPQELCSVEMSEQTLHYIIPQVARAAANAALRKGFGCVYESAKSHVSPLTALPFHNLLAAHWSNIAPQSPVAQGLMWQMQVLNFLLHGEAKLVSGHHIKQLLTRKESPAFLEPPQNLPRDDSRSEPKDPESGFAIP